MLHAAAGVRINELCSVEAGWAEGDEFPRCIEVRPSKSGFNEILLLKGRVSKEEDQPTRAEWVIGSRVRGSSYVPSAAKAIQILERIYRPWRAICTREELRTSLMLSFTGINGLPRREKGLGPISSDRLRNDMQKYISEKVRWETLEIPDTSRHGEDLTEYRKSRGDCITPHQWRKTFALFIFRIDANMTGALAQQFKHLSLAMTEEAYIGNDPQLLQAFDDVHLQQTVRFFHEMATGEKLAGGRVIKLMDRHEAELAKLVAGRTGVAEQRSAVEAFCIEQDLRIWYASHGKCLIGLSPKSARCHAIAGSTHWSNKAPAFAHRTPTTCAGCDCFVVDPEHIEFWKRRADESEAALRAAEQLGRGADYRVIAERARQATSCSSSPRHGSSTCTRPGRKRSTVLPKRPSMQPVSTTYLRPRSAGWSTASSRGRPTREVTTASGSTPGSTRNAQAPAPWMLTSPNRAIASMTPSSNANAIVPPLGVRASVTPRRPVEGSGKRLDFDTVRRDALRPRIGGRSGLLGSQPGGTSISPATSPRLRPAYAARSSARREAVE